MLVPPLPADEDARLASLRRMALLDTPDEEAFDRVTRTAQRLFGMPIALISLVDAQRQWFKSCVGLPVRETSREVSFCGHAILQDDIFVVEDASEDTRFADNPLVTGEPGIRFYAGRVLRNAEGFPVGTLCLIDSMPHEFSPADRQVLLDLGAWAEAVFRTRELGEVQQQMLAELTAARMASLVDPLLGVWNRRGIGDLLERELARALREGLPLSLLVIDFDHFKAVNDRYGHQAGDAVLCEGVRRIRSGLRGYDVLGRFGGEEFIVVLPQSSVEVAAAVAERVRRSVAASPMSVAGLEIPVTISIGAAGLGSESVSAAQLLEMADRAVYRAKAAGRDQVCAGP